MPAFYCAEKDCEETWETEDRGAMAMHMMTVHRYDPLKNRLKISSPDLREHDTVPDEQPDDSKLDPDNPEVNLRYATDPARSCGQCTHFSLPGSCELVRGAIRAVDSCSLWKQAARPQVDPEGHPTGAGGGKEAVRSFEAAYADQSFRVGESATLPKARNDADKNFSVNETVESLRSSGWYLADHSKEVAVFRHRKLSGHTLAIRGKRWEHRDAQGALVARQHVSKLAEYAESAPSLLKTIESLTAFNRVYGD